MRILSNAKGNYCINLILQKLNTVKAKIFLPLVLVAMTFFISCSEETKSTGDTGMLRVQITDAPFPHDLIAEANVTITKIEARLKSDTENEDEEKQNSFVMLYEGEETLNLLELTNGVTETLATMEVPVGSYDLIRVYVSEGSVVLADEAGTTFNLKVPSGEQTGIKVFVKPSIVVAGGITSDLLLDFDVSKSFVAQGGSIKSLADISGFHFKPVIKAANVSMAGSLKGLINTMEEEVLVGVEGAQISVFAADTLNTTTFSDADGNYKVLGLSSGLYDVTVDLEGYVSQTEESVEIVVGNGTTQSFELGMK